MTASHTSDAALSAGIGVSRELIVLFAVPVLLPGTGSVTPSGGVTVAVLSSAPVVAAGTVPLTVKVALVPTGRVTSASMLPTPAAVPHAAPAQLAVQVQPNPA